MHSIKPDFNRGADTQALKQMEYSINYVQTKQKLIETYTFNDEIEFRLNCFYYFFNSKKIN